MYAIRSYYESKVVVVNVDSDNGAPAAVGGVYNEGWVETEVRTLGTYAVMVDTIAPKITSLSIENNTLKETNRRITSYNVCYTKLLRLILTCKCRILQMH